MRSSIAGVPLYTSRTRRGVQRPRSWSPNVSASYAWTVGKWVWFVDWTRWSGFTVSRCWLASSGWPGTYHDYPKMRVRDMKKPPLPEPAKMPDQLPAYETAVLKKFKRLTAFLADRWYDDAAPRMPGSMWIDSDATSFKVLLKEPTLQLCARLRASTLDDLFAACEAFLGLDSPPWEVDQYAVDRSSKKSRK